MQKWEHCIFTAYETSKQVSFTLSFADHMETPNPKTENRLSIFDKLGKDGWELVAVNPLASGLNEFYFKKQAT